MFWPVRERVHHLVSSNDTTLTYLIFIQDVLDLLIVQEVVIDGLLEGLELVPVSVVPVHECGADPLSEHELVHVGVGQQGDQHVHTDQGEERCRDLRDLGP